MNDDSQPSILKQSVQYSAYFIAWLLLSAPGIWFFLAIRDNLFRLNVLLQLNPWAVRAIDRWGIFLFGLFWIAVIFSLEGYLRESIAKDQLWLRIRRVALLEIIFAIALLLIEWLINFIA